VSDWYRCEARWRNGTFELRPGKTYTLTDDFAAHVERDSPGVIRPLTAQERADVTAGLSYASEAVGHPITPPGPDRDDTAASRGHADGEAMSTVNAGMLGN
jgi:hypothetical protein